MEKNIVLITRPAPKGKELCNFLNKANLNTLWLPTIEFASTKNMTSAKNILETANLFDWIIFISSHAVRTSYKYLPKSLTCKIAAIGKATAQTLNKHGIQTTIQVKTINNASESLLELTEFQNISKQKIAIIKGENGRNLLTKAFILRGALITEVPTYTRQCPTITNIEQYQNMIKSGSIFSIIITSQTGLQNLIKILGGKCLPELLTINLIVISQRLKNIALQLGFKNCYQAKSADGDAIISILNEI